MSYSEKSKVDVILVNWNGGEQLERAVTPLLKDGSIEFKIIITDNGSTDKSLDLVNTLPVTIIKNGVYKILLLP